MTAHRDPTPSSTEGRHRLIVVSYLANVGATPRGDRTQELTRRLSDRWEVDIVAGPRVAPTVTMLRSARSPLRRLASTVHSSSLLDKFEPWSAKRFRSWHPEGTGALLIGFPFSPLVYAARVLVERDVPYVVDVGDPWVLTADCPSVRGVARRRSIRSERRLWSEAAGAIVTTRSQAACLGELFPSLPLLVRPNGYPVGQNDPGYSEPIQAAMARRPIDSSVLKIAHFGMISSVRIDIAEFLIGLSRSGIWKHIEFHQYGPDWTGSLKSLGSSAISVHFHDYESWDEVLASARAFDLAIVIGNRDPKQLPSKAIAYLQLPIARLAVVEDVHHDELAEFALGRSGWLVVGMDEVDACSRIQQHAARSWLPDELKTQFEDSWTAVANGVDGFLRDCFGLQSADTADSTGTQPAEGSLTRAVSERQEIA